MPLDDPAVLIQHLHKSYGAKVAVDDVSLTVAPGEIFGVLGPNGSGKTTTVECLQGLRRPDAGQLAVFGRDPHSERRAVQRLVGSQLQDSALPDRLKVWEALRLFSVIGSGRRPWQELLEEWRLEGCRDQAFADLSGGQRQRLFVALALVAEPRLVVLDEMTTGLDPEARRQAWELVAEIRDRGATVLLVTHFMEEAEQLCDRVAVLVGGRVARTGTVRDLMDGMDPWHSVRFTTAAGTDLGFLRRVEGFRELDVGRDGRVRVRGVGALAVRVGHALVEHGLVPEDLTTEQANLEDAYLALVRAADGRAER